MQHYPSVQAWITEARSYIRRDLDNMILFTGAEGAGKSTLAYQILKALDPTFGLPRIAFTIQDYIDTARNGLPKGSALLADEFLLNRRKAMHRPTVNILDFFQECRGLNLHHGLCFPHESLLDRAVMDFRIRFWIHVPKRGLFQVKRRIEYFGAGGEPLVGWKVAGQWNFAPNRGAEWGAYLEAKKAHMMRPRDDEEESEDEEWDLDDLRSLPGNYEDACRPNGPKPI